MSVSGDGVCKKSISKKTYWEAKTECESKGGHLYCPNSAAEINFVESLNDVWIGWRKSENSGAYACPYDNSWVLKRWLVDWKKEEGGDNCIKVKDNKFDGAHPCSHNHHYICNIDGHGKKKCHDNI